MRQLLNGERLDFLFLDGDHTYEGVKNDFFMYFPLVREGGLAALHDIVHHPSHPDIGVHVFWKELRQSSLTTREIVRDWKQGWGGIGVVFK
jgi:predicted O-methyltransferase YrrM